MKKRTGPPTIFTQPIAEQICGDLASGKSLRRICSDQGMPAESTVRLWVINDTEGFAAQYARARDIGLDCLADEILDIADTHEMGTVVTEDEDGRKVVTGDMVKHRQLRIDARKWYLCKLAPKKYGDKLEQTLQGGAVPIVISGVDGRL
jgi:hypothetical protein